MSFARYAPFLPGGPQRRVFFPDFWLKLVKSNKPRPPNVVVFHCPVQMTKFDIRNYLEKIYNLPVAKVNTTVVFTPILRDHRNNRWMKDEYKEAYVTLGEGQTFEFPELFTPPENDEESVIEDLKQKEKEQIRALSARGGLSTWFG